MAVEVFCKDPKTRTRTPVPEKTDCRILTNGSSAKWGGTITSEDFLPAPQPGRFQTYVSLGDQTAMIETGQRLEDIQKKFSFRVRDGHAEDELQFDRNRTTSVKECDTLTVGEDQKETVVRDQEVKVGNNQTVLVKELRKIAAKEIAEFGDEKITIVTRGEIVIQGPGGSITINSKGVTIQGVLVKIN
ncbi:MAG TPA: hypothetical protein VG324_30315 [Blastocatellia bacterium]|nr:hypothetical protein [Blastocatellia bacterium]